MANELAIDYGDTGLTDLYAVVFNATNQACLVSSGSFENINNSNSDLYDIALTEQGSSSIYLGSMPGSVAAGVYRYSVYQKNSSVADLQGDERVSYNETIQWDGSAEIPLSESSVGLTFLEDMIGGKWLIENNQMKFYKDDNSTLVATFDLYDQNGNPAMESVYERERA